MRAYFFLSLAVGAMSVARAQDAVSAQPTASGEWQRYDWLAPAEEAQRQAASGEKIQATAAQDVHDPFTTVSTGALYQTKYGATYTQQLSNGQKVGMQFQPVEQLTLRGNVHNSGYDALIPSNSTTTTGAAFSAETRVPLNNATLTVGANTDRTASDVPSGLASQTDAYDVQYQQPLSKLPLSAVLKGHFEGTSSAGSPPTSLPSIEQSLVWKPADSTTIQAGLRQQQYQEYPGVDHQLNEALFADWSQQVIDNVSWHSYAEVLNTRGLLDQAPASAIASGANGTAQATTPESTTSPTSSLPISLDDQTLTFSTGPSFRLQQDLSASVEYTNRWDKNPAPGSIGQEQRVSVSLKGTF